MVEEVDHQLDGVRVIARIINFVSADSLQLNRMLVAFLGHVRCWYLPDTRLRTYSERAARSAKVLGLRTNDRLVYLEGIWPTDDLEVGELARLVQPGQSQRSRLRTI